MTVCHAERIDDTARRPCADEPAEPERDEGDDPGCAPDIRGARRIDEIWPVTKKKS